jgi:hypothetical protein
LLILHLLWRPFPVPVAVLAALLAGRFLFDIFINCLLLMMHQRFIFPRLTKKQLLFAVIMLPGYLCSNQLLWFIYSYGAYYRSIKKVQRWEKVEHQGFKQMHAPKPQEELKAVEVEEANY